MMSDKVKGSIYGIVSAVSYGLNPLGGLQLGADGVNTHTILFSRFSLAIALFAIMLLFRAVKGNPSGLKERLKQQFLLSHCAKHRTPVKKGLASRISHSAWALVAILGVMFAISALSLYFSYLYMDSGIASTLLFVYPIIVALIMAAFFHERITIITVASLALALCGIGLLNDGGSSSSGFNAVGCTFVMISALAYSLYIVILNRWKVKIPTIILNMYVMAICAVCIALHSLTAPEFHLMMLPSAHAFGYAMMLAIVPTMISLVTMTRSIELIGSTPTAIMGSFEPITAVVVGVTIFHEAFTTNIAMGILLIILGVVSIICSRYISAVARKMISPLRHIHLFST